MILADNTVKNMDEIRFRKVRFISTCGSAIIYNVRNHFKGVGYENPYKTRAASIGNVRVILHVPSLSSPMTLWTLEATSDGKYCSCDL